MLNNLTYQQRLILATVLSAGLVVFYELFFAPKPVINEQSRTAQTTKIVEANTTTTIAAPVLSTNNAPSSAIKVSNAGELLTTVTSPKFEFQIDRYGRISQAYLLEKKFMDEKGNRQKLLSEIEAKPLEIRFADIVINEEAQKTQYTTNASTINADGKSELVLTQELKELNVTKRLVFNENGSYQVHISLSKNINYFTTPGFSPVLAKDGMVFTGTLASLVDGKIKTFENESHKVDETLPKSNIIASVDKYYATMLYDFNMDLDSIVTTDKNKNPTPFIIGRQELKMSGYIGPKTVGILKEINPRLGDVVEYGFFTFMAKPLFVSLDFMEKLVGNWGWAIVIFTIIIRLLLFPLTYKGMVSMNKLKELAPKLAELKEKYKGDSQKLNMHMMDMYKKHGANPMGGCLPLILQIPIFFAIYRVLLNSIELKGADWIFWISDLSLMDKYYVLPLLMGATMFIQQRITPQNFTDPFQEKVFKYLPIVFTFFFLAFPAGLTLYWFVNNLLSIGQQHMVNRLMAKNNHGKISEQG
jgi:YidC/Oxa1 family membrane protein insertase